MSNISNFWIGFILVILVTAFSVIEIDMVLSDSHHPFDTGIKLFEN